ncbi:MAG: glycosyltransferase family 4 protein, partial [Candidatus Nealsonbacteria bacterium]|nr:glycosyltransferase family 4 protein [Candidatus Nealsonbacteria bacterium]
EKIIIIPPNIKDYITARGISEQKIVLIPNGVDLSFYSNVKEYDGGNPDQIVFMYSGIFARYAGLETILKAAHILQSRKNKKAKFVLLGDGAEKPDLIRLAEELNLKNLYFYDMVSRSETLKIYEQADIFICIIKDIISSAGVSSKKLNDYMAFGRPIIFAVNSPKNPVEEANAGATVLPENPEALADAVEKMVELSPEKRADMARNAREYARKFLGIGFSAEKLRKMI